MGLNAGFEDDDIPAPIHTEVEPEIEIIEGDLNEFETAFESITYRLEHLTRVYGQTLEKHGMSQQLALEANNFMPFITDERPLGYFTVLPTSTQYRQAVEEMSAGIIALIAAAVAAVIALVYKGLKWLFSGSDGSSTSESNGGLGHANEDEAKAADKAAVENNEDLHKIDTELRNLGTSLEKLQKDYGEGGKNLEKTRALTTEIHPEMWAVLTNHEYLQALEKFMKESVLWSDAFVTAIARCEGMYKEFARQGELQRAGFDTWASVAEGLRKFEEDRNDPKLKALFEIFFPDNFIIDWKGQKVTMHMFREELDKMRAELEASKPQIKDIHEAFGLVAKLQRGDIIRYWTNLVNARQHAALENARKQLELLQKTLSLVNVPMNSHHMDNELRSTQSEHSKGLSESNYKNPTKPRGNGMTWNESGFHAQNAPRDPNNRGFLDEEKTAAFRVIISQLGRSFGAYLYNVNQFKILYNKGVVDLDYLVLAVLREHKKLAEEFVAEETEKIRKKPNPDEEEIASIQKAPGLFDPMIQRMKDTRSSRSSHVHLNKPFQKPEI